ncbi:MAG: hypothetical protein KME45_05410 [Stenomitos rutilans HA7619-LM2]|nr:hypothetical protein [Stenomitos rutilans HA7619-LM2]
MRSFLPFYLSTQQWLFCPILDGLMGKGRSQLGAIVLARRLEREQR